MKAFAAWAYDRLFILPLAYAISQAYRLDPIWKRVRS